MFRKNFTQSSIGYKISQVYRDSSVSCRKRGKLFACSGLGLRSFRPAENPRKIAGQAWSKQLRDRRFLEQLEYKVKISLSFPTLILIELLSEIKITLK